MCVCIYIHACVLEVSEHSGSQLRPSQQPSVTQLNLPSSSSPLPSKSARGARGTHVPQRTVFWVLNQGDGPRQQLPFSFYTIGVIPASCVLLLWSDVDLEVLHPLSHLHTLAHFSLARPFS